ncbi:MAG: monovalent cation/H(+) antiporter subunit G [Candidatus Hydrogenedentes bacterium]|nr:monovalent cation/H(+) antiporter subunit G [Candidatus Hydrogenedentota bacterium]
MTELLTALLIWIGCIFMLIAALGILRFADLFLRMHAAAKVGTVGLICVMLAVALHFPQNAVIFQAVLIILFFFLTAPVAAHLIAKAAYIRHAPLSSRTVIDEYSLHDHREFPASNVPESPGIQEE